MQLPYEQFCSINQYWLEDYAVFRALKITHNDAYYLDWPTELVLRAPAAVAQARRDLRDLIGRVRFAQFLVFRQAERLRAHAGAKEVRLIGDLPFLSPPIQAMCGPTRNCFCWMSNAGPASPPESLPIISVPTGSFGATPSTTGGGRRTGYRWCLDRLRTSNAALAIAPLQDLLNLGKEARMNLSPRRRKLALAMHGRNADVTALRMAARLTKTSNRISLDFHS